MQDIFADFILWFSQIFAVVQDPPLAALFIMGVSVSVSTMSNLAMKKFTDMRRLNRYQTEIKQHQALMKEAEKAQNTKMIKKLKRRKAYIDRIQREMLGARCKPSLLFIIPFFIIFSVLRTFYAPGGIDMVVAVLPFNVHHLLPFLVGMIGFPTAAGFGMTFWGFYFLVGLGLSSILQRVMGTQIT
ncbi:MAG: EMC3/TMCO1 family protein [Candidatus Thorarchaeota archaeon]